MSDRFVEVWLARPRIKSTNPRQLLFADARKMISSECKARGWEFEVAYSKIIHPNGRYREAISPDDATTIYRRAHNVRVGIWQFGDTYAPIRPELSRNPKHYLGLGKFLRHKAFHFNVGKKDFAAVWAQSLASFQEWLGRVDCEGQSDPRCLPFHIFGTAVPIEILTAAKGRRTFANRHGPQSNRRDDNDLSWRSPRTALHGGEQLHISGHELERGFHWDVDSRKRRRTVFTTEREWRVQRDEYLNIYPDGHIRPGNSRR